MAAKRTLEERIADEARKEAEAMERAKQYAAKKKQLERKKNEQDRKKRTKRLIECGAAAESVLGRPLVDGDAARLMNFLKLQERNGHYYSRAMGAGETEKQDTERTAGDMSESNEVAFEWE